MKAVLNPETVNAWINLHRDLGLPFTLSLSNYTTRITSLCYDIHFMRNVQSNRVFAGFAKIKKDIAGKPVKKFNPDELLYFNMKPYNSNFYADQIYNIDIRAAYATVLKNDGFITAKTFNYINAFPKQDRLTVVGMLAGRKNIFKINKAGAIILNELIVSDTADYFFHCVNRTAQVIADAAYIMGDDFIFSWVDGIYFSAPPADENHLPIKAKLITEFFSDNGFDTSIAILKNFEVSNKKSFYHCKWKDGEKSKYMNVPKPDNLTAKKIYAHLINKDYF